MSVWGGWTRRRHHHRPPTPTPVATVSLARDVASRLLVPRPDLDPMWAAHATWWRQQLPTELSWALPLLDPHQPFAVLCGPGQARDLAIWNHRLPNGQRALYSCRRRQIPAPRGGPRSVA